MILRFTLHKNAGTELKTLSSYDQLRKHIEMQFTENMTWEKVILNEIHLDHIRPICDFDLLNKEQQRQAFHYTNLQPLWAKDNLKKARRLPEAEARKCLPT